jgi:hypothetical protein
MEIKINFYTLYFISLRIFCLIALITNKRQQQYMELKNNLTNQIGPCGIICGTCILGNGSVSKNAKTTFDYINMIGIKDWAPMIPGGRDLNWEETEKTLKWMTKYAFCAGCEQGGGPPDCEIRSCAKSRSFEVCNNCEKLEDCSKFDWLGEISTSLKQKLKTNKGKTKRELIKEATIHS